MTRRASTTADDDADEIEFEAGERRVTHTDIKDWVPLADISVEAKTYYGVLRMHVNRKRGDRKVTATTLTLAKLMGRSRGDKTAPWLKELVALGAVQVARRGLTGRYVYRVNEDPPPGYTGPVNLEEWYDLHREELDGLRQTAKAKRDDRRAALRARKDQVSPVTPESGLQTQAAPVTPETGLPVTPRPGRPVTPQTGREPDVLKPDGVEPDPGSPTDCPRRDDSDAQLSLIPAPASPVDEPAGETVQQRAFGISRGWIKYRTDQGTPPVMRGGDPLHALARLVKPALDAEYSDVEVKRALVLTDTSLPSAQQFERALAEVRGKRQQRGNGNRPAPETLRVNDHWDEIDRLVEQGMTPADAAAFLAGDRVGAA